MTDRLNEREWELLSAYLDSSLSSIETREVEERLAKDTNFRAALTSLARTRGLLRSVPDVKRRRNFYLTPDMVRQKSWFWLVPVFNYSSVAAGLMAVILLAMDLLPIGIRSAPVQPALEAASAVQMDAAPAGLPNSKQMESTATQVAILKQESAAPAAGIQQSVEPAPSLLDESPSGGQSADSTMPTGDSASSEESLDQWLAPEASQPVGAGAAPMMKVDTTGLPEVEQSEALPPAGYGVPMERAVLEPTQSSSMKMIPTGEAETGGAELEAPAVAPEAVELAPLPSTTPVLIQTVSGEISTTDQPGPIANALAVPSLPAATEESVPVPDTHFPKGSQPATNSTETRSTASWGGWFLLLSIILGFCGVWLKKRSRL